LVLEGWLFGNESNPPVFPLAQRVEVLNIILTEESLLLDLQEFFTLDKSLPWAGVDDVLIVGHLLLVLDYEVLLIVSD